jgi:transposase
LWLAAAEIAGQRGTKIAARVLPLDTNSLKKWVDKQPGAVEPKRAKRKYTRRKAAVIETPSTFLELLAPSPGSAASCIVEVESPRGGKLRMELKGVATSEIAQLIQAFAGQ